MPRALWNGVVLAESEDTEVVEGNHYFPRASLNPEYFRDSDHQTMCPWKGVASYYDVVVGDEVNERAAWYYSETKDAAAHVKDRIAFWRGVEVED